MLQLKIVSVLVWFGTWKLKWYRPGLVTTLLLELPELHSNPYQLLHCSSYIFPFIISPYFSLFFFNLTSAVIPHVPCALYPGNSSQTLQLWFCSFAAFPEWVEHINSTEKDLGSDYTMSCVASGKPKPQIRWLKNGQLVICTLIRLYCSPVYLSNLDLAVKYLATSSSICCNPTLLL